MGKQSALARSDDHSSVAKSPSVDHKLMVEAFPAVDPKFIPCGSGVLVQIRKPKRKTGGGIILVDQTLDADKWHIQIALVIDMGPLAYKNRATGEPWPEGAWCKLGDFVRVPKYGGERFEMPIPGSDESVQFVLWNDQDIKGLHTGSPLDGSGYI